MSSERPARAVVVGKFLPFHDGHRYLLRRAVSDMSPLGGRGDVVVCHRGGENPSASSRADWIRVLHPEVDVHVVDDICAWHGDADCPVACSPAWAAHLRNSGLGPWTHVFGSDSYISPFAAALDATAVIVDELRVTVPAAGRQLRADLATGWDLLDPVVRAGLTRRVVIVGAESTGTTTLATDLAVELGVPWVSEFGRSFSEQLAQATGSIWDVSWESSHFEEIAAGQEARERSVIEAFAADTEASRPGHPWGPLVVCDTDVVATAVWHARYVGAPSSTLLARGLERPPLLYVLTSPTGVAFEQDGLRDGEALREDMTGWFRGVLDAQPTPWFEVTGSRQERVVQVRDWLAEHAPPPVATAVEAARADRRGAARPIVRTDDPAQPR